MNKVLNTFLGQKIVWLNVPSRDNDCPSPAWNIHPNTFIGCSFLREYYKCLVICVFLQYIH
uniref:Uncharacterized protein n=1 Tax=Anguilla anguilla TaxID=7936 RepID=A0A0E9X493_ANGAN